MLRVEVTLVQTNPVLAHLVLQLVHRAEVGNQHRSVGRQREDRRPGVLDAPVREDDEVGRGEHDGQDVVRLEPQVQAHARIVAGGFADSLRQLAGALPETRRTASVSASRNVLTR